jgi:molybdopterin converting factor small subunit
VTQACTKPARCFALLYLTLLCKIFSFTPMHTANTDSASIMVNVKFFALSRDLVGASELAFELDEGTSLGVLVRKIWANFPALERLPSFAIAVNHHYVSRDAATLDAQILCADDEVAVIPPVSGG